MASEPMHVDNPIPSTYRGVPLTDIPTLFGQSLNLKDMNDVQDPGHIFMIKPFKYDPQNPACEPEPKHGTDDYNDIWNDDHVRMPCSSFNITKNGVPKWCLIQDALTRLKQNCEANKSTFIDLKRAIENCNETQYNMDSLEYLINKIYSPNERNQFMSVTLPKMISLVLNVNKICTQPPPLLRIGSNRSVTISQKQAATLLSCGFFCLYPRHFYENTSQKHETYQSLNFNKLFEQGAPWKIEKLRCILHYFHRITEDMPKGVITFQRFALPNHMIPNWMVSQATPCKIHMVQNATIEDMHGLLQVDFANMFIGGGVMNEGCVQEEIRFTICPEMLVSLLVCEVMQSNECVFLMGCEQFTIYSGYATTFKAKDSFNDTTKKDTWGRKLCHVVAMDAIYYENPLTQYKIENIYRELIKAYTCFRISRSLQHVGFGIATGNWGCGAFNGDRELKAIIQLIAASEANRPLVYAAFHKQTLVESFWVVYNYLIDQKATVRHLWLYLQQYSSRFDQSGLFEFILTTPVSSLITN